MPNPDKDASVPGTLVSPDTNGATNWPPPSFNPDTGLLLRRHARRRSACCT